jgi:hypothetical protein
MTAILFVGDVVGGPGRRTLRALLPGLREEYGLDFVVVNGENVAGGLGITPKLADDLFDAGADVITLGNHVPPPRVWPYLDEQQRIIRPANYLRSQPGRGDRVVERDGVRLGGREPVGQPLHARRQPRVHDDRRGAARGLRRPARARRHARRGDQREGRARLVPRRPRDRRRRHPHARPDRRRARAAERHRLHHRRRDDRRPRRGDRRPARAVDRDHAHAHADALRRLRRDPWLNAVVIRCSAPGRADAIEQVLRPAEESA